MSSSGAKESLSALIKSITKYFGTLFCKITAVPCSSTNLATLEKFWFISVNEEKNTRKFCTRGSNYQTESWFLTEAGLYECYMRTTNPIAK